MIWRKVLEIPSCLDIQPLLIIIYNYTFTTHLKHTQSQTPAHNLRGN